MAILDSILPSIGRTPLVRLNRINRAGAAEVLVKVEGANPGGSAKDRAILAMVEGAEARGDLRPGGLIVEPTSGNSGIALAMVAAVKGYRLTIAMPDSMSVERRAILAAYGAKLVLTPGAEGMAGAIARAEEIVAATPGAWMARQFDNPDNPRAHELTTAEEILAEVGTDLAALVAGVGTGGTLSGCGRRLKAAIPGLRVVAVEPEESAVLSGGNPGPHRIQGIGAGFVPKNLDWSVVDRVWPVSSQVAGETARELARQEGLFVGPSSGAAVAVALEMAHWPQMAGKRILAILPDSGNRYTSGWPFEFALPAAEPPPSAWRARLARAWAWSRERARRWCKWKT